jgi:hypothetical protein
MSQDAVVVKHNLEDFREATQAPCIAQRPAVPPVTLDPCCGQRAA